MSKLLLQFIVHLGSAHKVQCLLQKVLRAEYCFTGTTCYPNILRNCNKSLDILDFYRLTPGCRTISWKSKNKTIPLFSHSWLCPGVCLVDNWFIFKSYKGFYQFICKPMYTSTSFPPLLKHWPNSRTKRNAEISQTNKDQELKSRIFLCLPVRTFLRIWGM